MIESIESNILIFLTPYEKSVIDLMQDKDNHYLLVDELFQNKPFSIDFNNKVHKNFHVWFDFYLFSEQMKCFFIAELSDDAFIYLFKRLNKKGSNGFMEVCLMDDFLAYDEWYTKIKNLVSSKALQILLYNDNLNDAERKLLWRVFFTYKMRLKEIEFPLKRILFTFKKDAQIINEVLDVVFLYQNRHIRYYFEFFEILFERNGMGVYPKIRKHFYEFLSKQGKTEAEQKEILKDVLKNFWDGKLNEMPYIKSGRDLDDLLKDLCGLSLKEMSSPNLIIDNADALSKLVAEEKDVLDLLPNIFFKRVDKLSSSLDLMKEYAGFYLNLMKYFSSEFNEEEKSEYEKMFSNWDFNCYSNSDVFLLVFHYVCYLMPDETFNENNPYCVNKELFKNFLKTGFFKYSLVEHKKIYSLFFDDADKLLKEAIDEKIKNNNIDGLEYLFAFYFEDKTENEISQYLKIIESNCKNFSSFVAQFLSNRYSSALGNYYLNKIDNKQEKFNLFYSLPFEFFLYDEFTQQLKEKTHILSCLSPIALLKTKISSYKDGFLSQYRECVVAKYAFFSNEIFDSLFQNKENVFIDFLNQCQSIGREYSWKQHFYVAMNFQSFNQEDKFNFNEHEKYMIEKLSKPIKLDYNFYFLKKEMPQIDF